MRPELTLQYDSAMLPISGKCSACGEQMPSPPSDPRDNVDAVLWFSHHFLIHRKANHPSPSVEETAGEAATLIQ